MDAPEPAAPPPPHLSVLPDETLAALSPLPGQCAVDCTLGAGGHSAALIARLGPGGRLIGIDADTGALEIARQRLAPLATKHAVTLDLVHSNFSRLKDILLDLQAPAPNAILADLGVSSMQFDDMSRGFSFRSDEILDMRMDRSQPRTAADILRDSSESELADILFYLGEEYKARKIARAMIFERQKAPIETTGQLEKLVLRALRVRGHRRINPATKTFQALRIAVNRELESLDALLADAPGLLAPGGAFGAIAFHSLEDRRVKVAFKALCETGRFNQERKFARPGPEEEQNNPRSRSAKLRVVRKTDGETIGQNTYGKKYRKKE